MRTDFGEASFSVTFTSPRWPVLAARFQSAGTPLWLHDAAYPVVMDYLKKLIQKYPDVDLEAMLLSALAVTWKNANAFFFVYTLEDYLGKNPSQKKSLQP